MRIVLLGYMASGKSTVGKLLAEKLALRFADMDEIIEKQTGRSVAGIFRDEGENAFREKEKRTLEMLLKKDSLVIAAGGGTPCFFDNMQQIKAKAISIYLELDPTELSERLSDPGIRSKRPLLKKAGGNLRDFIGKALRERARYYQQADLVVNTAKKNVNEIADEIISGLKKRGPGKD